MKTKLNRFQWANICTCGLVVKYVNIPFTVYNLVQLTDLLFTVLDYNLDLP